MVCQLQCERTREKISFEPLSENRNDVWQTVPEAATDWKSSVADSYESCSSNQ